jgi:hypothetical protein
MAGERFLRPLLLWAACVPTESILPASYSQNIACSENNCINPLFPGLNDLPLLEQLEWQCAERYTVEKYLGFCKGAVRYNPALPSPQGNSLSLDQAVGAQDDAAATMFFYHVTGMGYEAWEHSSPASGDDECIRSVWRMSCLTYFPKAQAGCQVGAGTRYHRPCAGLCENYLRACAVECCDDSARCMDHGLGAVNGSQAGYVDETDPDAPECSGRSGGGALHAPAGLLLALLGLVQQCSGFGGLQYVQRDLYPPMPPFPPEQWKTSPPPPSPSPPPPFPPQPSPPPQHPAASSSRRSASPQD